MKKEMTLNDLTEHIKNTVGPILEAEFGDKVKAVVQKSVEDALTPIRGDLGKAEAERKEMLAKVNEAASGKSTLTDAKKERQKGEAFGRCVWALRRSKNDTDKAIKILKDFGDDDIADLMVQSQNVQKAMTAGDPETGGILIPQPVSQEIIDILRARVAVRSLNPVMLPMPNGNFTLPKKTQGTSAFYVGESTAGTTSKVETGHVKLTAKKLVTIVPASNDLFRYSSPAADQIIRDDIVSNSSVRQDQAFLRDDGTDATPKGLLQWAIDNARTLNANGTVNLANVTTDLGKLILKLIESNVPMIRPGWIMAPRTWNYLMTVRTTNGPYAFRDEMSRGTLWGWPFVFTTQVPINLGSGTNESDLYLADFADVVIGDTERLIIDASGEAAYEEGGSVKAAFHRDETVIRGIAEHDLVVRRVESIAVLRQLKWGA